MSRPQEPVGPDHNFLILSGRPVVLPERLRTDRWVASSALQKAIRRSETATALRAGFTYLSLDRASFWRRLPIIAAEEVGCADYELVASAVQASCAPSWRASVGGDWRVAASLIESLSQTPKDRGMPALYEAALSHPNLGEACSELGRASDAELLLRLVDQATPLPVRAIAAWYLCGTSGLKNTRLVRRNASPACLESAWTTLAAPRELIRACSAFSAQNRYLLAAFVPLLWHELDRSSRWIIVRDEELRSTAPVRGIPLYALDKHTSKGKQAIAAFAAGLRASGSAVALFLHERVGGRAIELAVFHAEGGRLRSRLSTPIEFSAFVPR